MIIIAGMVGIVIGLLLNPVKGKVVEKVQEYKEIPKGKTQFFDSIISKEIWDKAKSLKDLI